jgi:glucose-6-phosphate 1-dehydrogenase
MMSYRQLRDIIGQEPTVFYLSLPPKSYPSALKGLAAAGLLESPNNMAVVEKPIAPTLPEGQALQELLRRTGKENRVELVEHFNLKESFANLLAFRHNTPFEPLLSRRFVSEIRICALEKIPVGKERASFFESVGGCLKDMHSHLILSMLLPIIMELPASLDIQEVRKQKEIVALSLRVTDAQKAVWGQYSGYREECGNPNSKTPTLAAFTLESTLPRWKGVPLKIITGKALPDKHTGVEIVFKQRTGVRELFPSATQPARLVFRHHPNEGICFYFNVKQPGSGIQLEPVKMEFTYQSAFHQLNQPAYVKLLSDILLAGDKTSFSGAVEAIQALRVAEILEAGRESSPISYQMGTFPVQAKDWLPVEARGWL